jgi:hypothetical protein
MVYYILSCGCFYMSYTCLTLGTFVNCQCERCPKYGSIQVVAF